jgi:hypothetical protein
MDKRRTEKRKTGKKAKLKKARRLHLPVKKYTGESQPFYEHKHPKEKRIDDAKSELWRAFSCLENYPVFTDLTYPQLNEFVNKCLHEQLISSKD